MPLMLNDPYFFRVDLFFELLLKHDNNTSKADGFPGHIDVFTAKYVKHKADSQLSNYSRGLIVTETDGEEYILVQYIKGP